MKMNRKPQSHVIVLRVCFQGVEQESKGLPCKKGIVQSIVGQGFHRKIILTSQSTQNTIYRSVSTPPVLNSTRKVSVQRFSFTVQQRATVLHVSC